MSKKRFLKMTRLPRLMVTDVVRKVEILAAREESRNKNVMNLLP